MEQSGSKAGPRRAADGEPGWHLCLGEATCSASRMEWGGKAPMALTWGWQFLLGVKAAVYYSIFFCVCWDCLAEDGGGGMKTVNLVQNN